MRGFVVGAMAVVGCGSSAARPDATAPAPRALGMNDVSILVPLPDDLARPTLLTIEGPPDATDDARLILPASEAALMVDVGPKNALPVAYGDFHVVAIRFDLCERVDTAACTDGEDGRLRLVLQPLYRANDATLAHDIALHAFYPIPAGELAAVIAELRGLAALQDAPVAARLAVSPALSSSATAPVYRSRLLALVAHYARWDRLVKVTIAGQNKHSAAFAWIFRGFEGEGFELAAIPIPDLGDGVTKQTLLVAGGDTVYAPEPIVDDPGGLQLALNGQSFATATQPERMAALATLAEVQNPTRQDASTVQCISCHVATFLTRRRAEATGVEPSAIPGTFTSATYDLGVDTIAGTDARVVRAFGWAASQPAISQRVANETALVLAEIEQRF